MKPERCAERGCPNPPGTPWTPYWCLPHDEERRARITRQLDDFASRFKSRIPASTLSSETVPDEGVDGVSGVSERVRVRHFGDAHHDGHRADSSFDFYCVAAHGEDYSPKYLEGEKCHDSMGEGYCHDNCNLCVDSACPIEPCPLVDEYGDPR